MTDPKTDKPTLVPQKPAPQPPIHPSLAGEVGYVEKIDPRDIPPQPPPFALRETDFTHWQMLDRLYKERLSEFEARQALKIAHPELKGVSW